MTKIIPLTENHLFSKVYLKGKKATSHTLIVYALKNYRSQNTFLGITTSKKLGNAVTRSRSRRLIREAYRRLASEKKWLHPFFIVIVARGAITDQSVKMWDVYDDMKKAFDRLELFEKE